MDAIQAQFQLAWQGFSLAVDLTLPSKGVTALFGHSGSGKTTLLRCIAGLERPSSGKLCVNGDIWQDATHWLPTHKRPIGYVFQEASLFSHLSVMGNLRYGMRRSYGADSINLEQAIELLGIAHLLERKPNALSGGERQRVGIARALAITPRLLLMDEPLAALDLKRKQEILPYLERLHDELDIPIIYVSHSPDEVARLADHLVVMEDGRVLASGALSDTLARLDLPISLGENAGTILDGIVGEVDARWHMVRVDFAGGHLWVRDQGMDAGRHVRVRVLARDVSLALEPGHSSIQNALQGEVDALGDDEHPSLALVRIRVGGTFFLARITKRALNMLNITVGSKVWAQIKSGALLG